MSEYPAKNMQFYEYAEEKKNRQKELNYATMESSEGWMVEKVPEYWIRIK